MDGLDPDFISELGLGMEYEAKLSVPVELYNENNEPWTPRVWSSMFSGKLEIYPLMAKKKGFWLRVMIRKFLISRGIEWSRKGFKVTKVKEDSGVYSYMPYLPRLAENLIFDERESFLFHVPAVSVDYLYGGYDDYCELEWEQFNVLALSSRFIQKELVVIYTRIIDVIGHKYIEGNINSLNALVRYYKSVFELADIVKLGGATMVLSDHGCFGSHTHYAYIGCTHEIEANSVLDVRANIEAILDL